MSSQTVFLLDTQTGRAAEAQLVAPLGKKHIADWRDTWRPFQVEQVAQLRQAGVPIPEHTHWSWEKKEKAIEGLLAYRGYALELDGMTQGMAVHSLTPQVCRLASQEGKPLVYVNFIEAAPWNRSFIGGAQRYRGVGSILVGSAVSLSFDENFQGRVGLHSLRQADSFYRDACKMTEMGPDKDYHDLRYFEMTPSQAELFATRGLRA